MFWTHWSMTSILLGPVSLQFNLVYQSKKSRKISKILFRWWNGQNLEVPELWTCGNQKLNKIDTNRPKNKFPTPYFSWKPIIGGRTKN
jgi:hypothetical protein